MSAWIAPAPRDWPGRARWLADAAAGKQVSPALCESPQAAALLAEMARVFCAGAWPSAVILAQAVIDAELAARLAAGNDDPMALNALRFGADFVWLRDRRNRLIHGSDEDGRRRVGPARAPPRARRVLLRARTSMVPSFLCSSLKRK